MFIPGITTPCRRAARPVAWVAALAGAVVVAAGLAGCSGSGSPARTSPTAGVATSSSPTTGATSARASAAGASAARSSAPATSTRLSRAPADTAQASDVRALDVLAQLPIKGRAPLTGYSRAQFGQAWTDDNDDPDGHNGCDTRNDILRRDLTGETLKPDTRGCVVLTGTLADPYTGATVAFTRGPSTSTAVQIDHVVALGDAWQTGAQQLTPQQRVDLANDPLELLAVDGSTNEAKGDGDAATWLPPNKAYRCAYVARQIAVKSAYDLWVTPAEHDAMQRVLTTCPGEDVPHETRRTAGVIQRPPTSGPPTAAGRSTGAGAAAPPSPSGGSGTACTTTSSGNCIRGGELCPEASVGRSGVAGNGARYLCTGSPHPRWEPI